MAASTKLKNEKKLFFTTTDLLQRLNSSIQDSVGDCDNVSSSGGFELQRQMPDGSYRRAEEGEVAAANFQTKMKQAAEMTADMTPQQKIEWATHQRKEGNRLFANHEYHEAMDVYLTCLVAIDTSNDAAQENNSSSFQLQCENEIQLPVLLNLALCSMQLGMYSKAEKFCNHAIELKCGKRSPKLYFRRGKVRMMMGNYVSAELDLDRALDLLDQSDIDGALDADELNKDKKAILREKQKLHQLIRNAEKNSKAQKKAMRRLFQSSDDDPISALGTDANISNMQQTAKAPESLYPEKKAGTRKCSTLRDDPTWDHSIIFDDEEDTILYSIKSYFYWYLQIIGRGAEKLLKIIGEEDTDLDSTTGTSSAAASSADPKSKIE